MLAKEIPDLPRKAKILTEETERENESESDADIDEKVIEEQLNATVWGDLRSAVYESRFIAPILAFFGFLLAYHITIAPYRVHHGDDSSPQVTDLAMVRPMLSDETQKGIHRILLQQENEVLLPEPLGGSFTMRFVPHVDKHGTHELPDMFYEGVMFGISSTNSHRVEYSKVQPMRSSKELLEEISAMRPVPTNILPRIATCNNTDWMEKGYGVYFSYKDLEAQGMLSSDVLQPWKRVLDPVLWVARKFKQVSVTVWYPHRFGEHAADATTSDVYPKRKYKHVNIIQTIIPTRTGLDMLKSTSAVWMMERNNTRVQIPPRMVRAPPVEATQEQYVTVDSF